jgi:hypothetical protein
MALTAAETPIHKYQYKAIEPCMHVRQLAKRSARRSPKHKAHPMCNGTHAAYRHAQKAGVPSIHKRHVYATVFC